MADEHPNPLLVKDEAIIALAEQQILPRNGYEVQVVHSGEAAITAAAGVPVVSYRSGDRQSHGRNHVIWICGEELR